MYGYAGNNPVRYTDPDGNIVIPAVVIFYFAVFAATAVELYLLSPSGQQSIQVAGEALAYGVQYASQAVFNTINNTVDCIKKNVAYYNATKAKAQKVTNEQTKESNVIRFQL